MRRMKDTTQTLRGRLVVVYCTYLGVRKLEDSRG